MVRSKKALKLRNIQARICVSFVLQLFVGVRAFRLTFFPLYLPGVIFLELKDGTSRNKPMVIFTYCKRDSGTRNFHCGSDCVCGADSSEKNLDSSLGKLCFPSPGLT